MTATVAAAIEAATSRYVEKNPKSKPLFEKAKASLPGGNTRTLLYTAPFPIIIRKGDGHKLIDEDGNVYQDFVGEMTAGLFGHSHPRLQEAIISAVKNVGLSLGATNPYEQRYAELICSRFSLDRMRFTNSGTEANLHCLAAARRFTGRRKIMVFRGGYHGSVLSFPSDVSPNNVDLGDWVLVQYNDPDAVKQAFTKNSDIAAVIVEAMQGNGAIPATIEFLKTIRSETTKAGALFIIDEVVTSRLSPGGLRKLVGIEPDLVTLGKYLGGGMPFGAFGGRADIMSVYDPSVTGSLTHNGTFQNNTIMLNAGYVGLSEVYTPDVVELLNNRGEHMRRKLAEVFKGTKFCVTGRGSLMCVHATNTGMQPSQMTCKDDINAVDALDLRKLFWLDMLDAGFWVQPRGSIALNLQIPDEAIKEFIDATARFCDKYRDLVVLPKAS
ncbi:PLP-dependent transferase [Hypoxylon rubiginosum]|uniref:PLP-dependent transferase n=1 Tax=Hypoxylon rubiginosum TaxID=110542 RepID=A0ACC0CW96_9PEZI|nr:PLP-dependent transferase [Hypoxylon rubiginosum]